MKSFLRDLVGLLLALSLCASASQAAPVSLRGREMVDPAAEADTPQAKEFRAGIQAQLNGKMDIASQRFQAALKLDPKFAPALIGLAGVAQAQGNRAQIEGFLQQAETASPTSPAVHLAWGRYHLGNGQLARAEKSFNVAKELAPKAIPPLLALGEIYMRAAGRNDEALRVYRAAVALDNQNMFAQYGLGVAAAAAGLRTDALKALDTASQLAPKDPAPPRAIGRLHMEAGELKAALRAFDAGLARQPRFVPLMLDRAEVLVRSERWDAAFTQLQAAQQLMPKSAEVQVRLGDFHQTRKHYADAKLAYLQAIELEPRSPFAYNNLAWMTVLSRGDAKDAVQWARQAVQLSPQSPPFHDTLALALRAAGELSSAQASLAKAIELEPKYAGYQVHLAELQSELKQPAAARASLLRAIELQPKGPEGDKARKLLKALPAP
jgi:tetratricopeptide (TPR) repeat protein